jgi:hypothetical protein
MAYLRLYKAVRPMPGFHVDEPPTSARYTTELFAQARPDGRIMDLSRSVLGGSEPLDATFKLGRIYPEETMADWSIQMQSWPRDLQIRKGLLSTQWQNIADAAAARNARIFDEGGAEIPVGEFLRRAEETELGQLVGAMRWAIALTDSARMCLQLQGLPASASTLNGKPSLKR